MTTLTDATILSATPETPTMEARLVVEYWTVAMDGQSSCDSCDETLTAVHGAADKVRPIAQQLGISVDIVPRVIGTWAEAVDHGIAASPTIRAADLELRPSHPDDSEARIWQWRHNVTTSAPLEALLDLLLQALGQRSRQLTAYFADGGLAPYVRQFLQTPAPEASTPAVGCCGAASD